MKGKRGEMKWMKVEMKFSYHYTLTTTLSSYNRIEKADWFLGEWWLDFENLWKNCSANSGSYWGWNPPCEASTIVESVP